MSRWFPALSLLLLAGSAAAQVQTPATTSDRLRDDHVLANWAFFSDVLRANVSQEILSAVAPATSVFGPPTLEMSELAPPSITEQNGVLSVRFPEANTTPITNWRNWYQLSIGWQDCPLPIGDASFYLEFAMEGSIDSGGSTLSAVVNEFVINDALETLGVVDLLASLFTTCTDAEACIADLIEQQFDGQTTEFATMHLAPPLGVTPGATLMLAGDPGLTNNRVVNIHLVADGWTAATLPDYDFLASQMAAELSLSPDDPNGPRAEPFSSFSHAIQVTSDRQTFDSAPLASHPARVVVPNGGSDSRTGIGNLLAWSTHHADSGADIVVFVADARTLPPGIRASAGGSTVLLPVDPSDPSDAVDVFLHELGHTWLGELVDQHTTDHTDDYLGFELAAVNVTTDPLGAKWDLWSDSIDITEGAFGYPGGLFRPSAVSRMGQEAAHAPFDVIGREALTMGLQDAIQTDWVTLAWETLGPYVPAAAVETGAGTLGAIVVQDDVVGGSLVRVSVEAASVPRPFAVSWTVVRGAEITTFDGPDSVDLQLFPGDEVSASVTTATDFVREPFAFPTVTAALETQDKELDPSAPAPPVFGTPLPNPRQAFYDPTTGVATSDAAIGFFGSCYPNWTLRCSVELRYLDGGQVVATQVSAEFPDGAGVSHPVGFLPGGTYLVEARSRVVLDTPQGREVRTGAWVQRPTPLVMQGLSYELGGNPPHDPVRLRASTCDGVARLRATSWDVDGDPLQIQFEARPASDPFLGDADPASLLTGPVRASGQPAPADIRLHESVTYSPNTAPGTLHHARARVLDDLGAPGPWVDFPRDFVVGGLDTCRGASFQDRLAADSGRWSERPDWYRDLLRGGGVLPPSPVPCPGCALQGLLALPATLATDASGAPMESLSEVGIVSAVASELQSQGYLVDGIEPPIPILTLSAPANEYAAHPPLADWMPRTSVGIEGPIEPIYIGIAIEGPIEPIYQPLFIDSTVSLASIEPPIETLFAIEGPIEPLLIEGPIEPLFIEGPIEPIITDGPTLVGLPSQMVAPAPDVVTTGALAPFSGSELAFDEVLDALGSPRFLAAEIDAEGSTAGGGYEVSLTLWLADPATGAELWSSATGTGTDRDSALTMAASMATGPLVTKMQAFLDAPASADLNPCCTVGTGPGCGDASVQATVCAQDAYCCDVAWDALCVGEVTSIAGVSCTAGAGAQTCCEASSAPGCSDSSVEAAVCAQDAYCCDVAWDALCVDEVTTIAGGSCSASGGN